MVKTSKDLKAEIKSWRKELGNERRAKIKLEKELEKAEEEKHEASGIIDTKDEPISLAVSPTNHPLEISCTICAEPIEEYAPLYFQETEMNPACLNCQDSSISWEMRSSPPGITPMVAQTSPKATQIKASLYVAEESVDAENEVKTVKMEIRSRVKAKLENRFRNGELSRNAMDDLEEELVKELEEELAEDYYKEEKLFD